LLEEAMRASSIAVAGLFVHNRIETIETVARGCGHSRRARGLRLHTGRCARPSSKPSWAIRAWRVDVLVSTMIVESGLDVPNANTMIVDRAIGSASPSSISCADGGRSHRRAFCYLLVPDLVDAQAEERLQVLEIILI